MGASDITKVASLARAHEAAILSEWLGLQKATGILNTGRVSEQELTAQSKDFLRLLTDALEKAGAAVSDRAYDGAKEMLNNLSRSRALQGFSPSETATFIFSLKQPLFNTINRDKTISPEQVAQMTWESTLLLDELGLYTLEVFQKSREEVILRQQREISELSTPVVKLWDGIVALPLIGTLDSERTQVVMENLLNHIVSDEAEIAIIDITGVPTVDTLTAQHLLKTVSAARLMGADCIISGIRPQIAQTMVHLGVELSVVSKATLADALAVALKRTGRGIRKIRPTEAENAAKRAQDA